jgi:hypothetical protein
MADFILNACERPALIKQFVNQVFSGNSMKEQGNTMKGATTAMHTFVTICAQQAHGC